MPNADAACQKLVGGPGLSMCLHSLPQQPIGVAVVGDSHANSLFPGMAAMYQPSNTGVINLGMPGCPPLFDTEVPSNPYTDSCARRMNPALNFAVNTPTIHTIVLAMRGPSYLEKTTKIQWPPANGQTTDQVFNSSLRNTLDRLLSTGKQIALVIDWPSLGFHAKECIERPLLMQGQVRTPCAITRAAFDQQHAKYRQLMAHIHHDYPQVVMLDSMPLMCDANWCYAIKDNQLLYHDDHHLSKAGSAYLSRAFFAQLQNPSPHP